MATVFIYLEEHADKIEWCEKHDRPYRQCDYWPAASIDCRDHVKVRYLL